MAIARALCVKPEDLPFDEATSAVDPEMTHEVLEVMTDLAQSGMTMICVRHEMRFAHSVADRMVFRDEGKIIKQADTGSFFGAPKNDHTKCFLNQILKRRTITSCSTPTLVLS